MSHRWDCPTRWEAEREGQRAFERGEGSWRNPYNGDWHNGRLGDGCEDAERAWRDGHRGAERREEERQEEQRIEQRREMHRREEAEYLRAAEEQAYWDSIAEQQADDHYAGMAEQMFVDALGDPVEAGVLP